jgi:hypothetical protein
MVSTPKNTSRIYDTFRASGVSDLLPEYMAYRRLKCSNLRHATDGPNKPHRHHLPGMYGITLCRLYLYAHYTIRSVDADGAYILQEAANGFALPCHSRAFPVIPAQAGIQETQRHLARVTWTPSPLDNHEACRRTRRILACSLLCCLDVGLQHGDASRAVGRRST